MNMELGLGNTLLAGDPRLVDHIVGEVKSQGIFDQFRKECIADVDTKPAYQNLRTRVESSVNSFLGKQTWKADLNKNQLRETLRKHIVEAPYLDVGVERIVDQVVNPKVYSVFMPQIEDVVYKFLGLERPRNRQRNGPCGFKDLLPKDLDPVSPESDKNSLKDVSLDSVDAHVDNPDPREKETSISSVEQSRKDDTDNNNSNDRVIGRNGDAEIEDKSMDDPAKSSVAVNLNSSVKSDDKTEEEEEDSPTFEPIDIMNLNESNISNDSHLSGISELTSHRSRSPDFSNDASRDNMDFSNQDSQFSKVSSDSRLSIVTDFGSSNHASTPMSDAIKDEKTESKYSKDNFKAVREFESGKGNKDGKTSYESERSKENTPSDLKPLRRSFSSKETSRDGMESGTKDSQRNDSKSRKSDPKDSKKEREKDNRKKSNNHEAKSSEKSSKRSVKEKAEEKSREKDKEKEKKEPEKKDKNEGKETKDLKDIYKEKIRELREKKELTEKEKLSKDKDSKATKDTKDKRDSSKDKRESKEHKSSSSSKSSSRSDNKNVKSSTSNESKGARSESRDKGKRDERRYSKSKNTSASADEKGEGKRLSRSDEKTEKSEVKDSKQKTIVKKEGKNGDKRESKSEADKEKKRREEKKTKAKDDHSSLRKNSEDRRSTDRDGSNGSNGKSSQKSSSNSGASSTKPSASNLPKESTNTSNSSSETSDSIEESQNEKLKLSFEAKNVENSKNAREHESQAKKLDLGQNEITLPIKKRPFSEGSGSATTAEVVMKKPKFAKNFQEAKRLMKIRKKMEKEKIKRQQEMEKIVKAPTTPEIKEIVEKNDLELVPDDERVQIIEVCDEEYDEPYPEIQSNFTLEERSQIILGGESIFMGDLPIAEFKPKSTLSEMELSIRQSLNEMISDKKIEETQHELKKKESTADESECKSNESIERSQESSCQEIESSSNTEESLTKDSTESQTETPEIAELPVQITEISDDKEKISVSGNEKNEEKFTGHKNEENEETAVEIEDEENKEKVAEIEITKNTETVAKTEITKNQETVTETENKVNKELVVETENEENKKKVAETKITENKGNLGEIESEENMNTVTETENAENKGDVTEIESKEIIETVAANENEENTEIVAETETKRNEEEVGETETKRNEGEVAETESDEKIAETENDENEKTVVKSENDENQKKLIGIKSHESEQTLTDTESRENKENVTDINSEEDVEMSAGIRNEEDVEMSAGIKNKENVKMSADEKNEENVEMSAGEKNEENVGTSAGIKNKERESMASDDKEEHEGSESNVKNEKIDEKVIDIVNEENEEKVVVTRTCTKDDGIVRKAEDAQTLETRDNTEATETVKSLANDGEIASLVVEKKAKILEAPVREHQPAVEVVGSEIPLKMEMEPESCQSIAVKTTETCDEVKKTGPEASAPVEEDLAYLSDEVPCLYFEEDNERLEKFTKFMKALEQKDEPTSSSAELSADMDTSTGVDEAVSSLSKPMAPPKPKRKYSTSPLTDILLNNANNNNDAHKITAAIADDEVEPNSLKKRKIGRPKKQRSSASLCGQQNLLNGENFVMPLSPESDVSATSEKTPSHPLKDEKSRPRGSNQRYTSDDLYKPRPLFASSSRRSRRSNPA